MSRATVAICISVALMALATVYYAANHARSSRCPEMSLEDYRDLLESDDGIQ